MTENEYENILKDFNLFQGLFNVKAINQQEIFKKIGEMDDKYSRIEYYNQNINGLICNLGFHLKNIYLLKYAIKRIQENLNHNNSNKLRFDLGNCIQAVAEIENKYPHSITDLIKTNRFNEARKIFLSVEIDDLTSYEMALTNSANLLEKYGRNFEAIILYNKVLDVNPNFGMAYGNKALAIDYYICLAPQKSYRLMRKEVELFKKTLQDTNLLEIGGQHAKIGFEQRLVEIENYLKSQNQLDIIDNDLDKNNLTEYEIFLLNNNFLLNFDFGYYYDKHSLQDTFLPSLIQYIDEEKGNNNVLMSDRVYFSFQVFNQIIETYTTARLSYFELLRIDYTKHDKTVNYIYTLDYARHSVKYGLLKSIFCDLYNCLDKISHLVAFYYVDDKSLLPKDLYFDWLQKDVYKDIVINKNNFQLLALRNLSLDFQEGYQYYNLKKIRNRITHSFLNINEGIGYSENFKEYEITEEMLIGNVKDMFLVVKAALMYFEIAVRTTKPEGLMMPMEATLQKDIFFD